MFFEFNREDVILKNSRWDYFREKREIMMDKYILVKKRCKFAYGFTRLICLVKTLKQMWQTHE